MGLEHRYHSATVMSNSESWLFVGFLYAKDVPAK